MSSKDIKSKTRLGKTHPGRVKFIVWALGLGLCGGGGYAAYHFAAPTEIEIPSARVRRADFIISVRTRGDIKSAQSRILKAPQVPGLRITHLAENGRPIRRGEVVVEFDSVNQEQNVLNRTTGVQSANGSIVQAQASQRMVDEQDAMNKMSSEYALERSKLDASKAEVISQIEGEKFRIQVGVSEGSLQQVKASINAHQVGHESDLNRLTQSRDKMVRDLAQANNFLSLMKLTAPSDGIVTILPNFRSQGGVGQAIMPPFKEGDNAWTGAEIAEIPDLTQMYVDLKLDEADRGKLQLGQTVKVRVDAIPDKEFAAEVDWISPIASLIFKGGSTAEKTFPARATLKSLDDRLRPGMSSTAEIIIEKQPNMLLIPTRASFDKDGKPGVFLQTGRDFVSKHIDVGKKNEEDIIVTSGLKEGDMVALENPVEAAKRAKKKF